MDGALMQSDRNYTRSGAPKPEIRSHGYWPVKNLAEKLEADNEIEWGEDKNDV